MNSGWYLPTSLKRAATTSRLLPRPFSMTVSSDGHADFHGFLPGGKSFQLRRRTGALTDGLIDVSSTSNEPKCSNNMLAVFVAAVACAFVRSNGPATMQCAPPGSAETTNSTEYGGTLVRG